MLVHLPNHVFAIKMKILENSYKQIMMQSFKWYLLSVAEFNGCKMIIMSHKSKRKQK